MRRLSARLAGLLIPALLAGCATSPKPGTPTPAAGQLDSSATSAQYASTYARRPFQPVVIRNATILTGVGAELQGSVLFADGRIIAVGGEVTAPADALVIDGSGKFVTPGLIDTHSHIGVYAAPGTFAEG